MLALGRSQWLAPLIVLALAATSCGAPQGTANSPQQDRDADEAAIHALLAEVEAAANQRDPARTAATYTPDGDIWIAGGPWVSGTAEIRQFEEEFYQTPGYRGWRVAIDTMRFVSPDVVLVEVSSATTLDSGEIRDRATLVVARRDGVWKIAAVRIMSVEEQP